MKHFPNAITGLRIILSLVLLLLVKQPLAYVVVYLCCGISDVADGYIARRFKLETALGAKLDSVADFIFFAVNLFLFITTISITNPILVITLVSAIALIRFANIALARRKFHQWGIVHTIANKATGLMLFLAMPVCVFLNTAPLWLSLTVCVVAAIAAIEESIILITTKTYDANRKSLFS